MGNDSNVIDAALIMIIKEIKDERVENGREPSVVTMQEYIEEVQRRLRELYKRGAIKAGKTVNGAYLDLK